VEPRALSGGPFHSGFGPTQPMEHGVIT
jgi:hypothetical protein